MLGVAERFIVVRNALFGVGADHGFVEKLPFLVVHVGDQQAEKDVQPLDLGGQHGVLHGAAVELFIDRAVCLSDLHDVDAVGGCGRDLDERTADVGAGPMKFVPFERRNDEHLNPFATHPKRHELHGKGLAAAARAENGDVGVFVDTRIKDVHNDERIVVLVDAEQDAVVVTQLIRRERIAARRAQRQHIPLAAFKERFIQLHERKRRAERLFLTEIAALHVHVLRNEQLFHLRTLPVQIVRIVRSHGDEQIQIVEIFMVAQTILQEISAADGAVEIVKVCVGIAGLLDLTAVDTKLLAELADHAILWLARQKYIEVNAVPSVDQKAKPACGNLGFIPVRRHQQIRIIRSVDAEIAAMREIQLRRRKKITDGNLVDRAACLYVVGCNMRDALQKRNIRTFLAAKKRIEHFSGSFVLIFMLDDAVATLPEIICRRPRRCLKSRNSVRFLSILLRAGQRFIFHDEKESPRDGFSGAELFEQLQIVLLLHPAAFVRFLRHLPAHGFYVPIHIRTFRDNLDLQLDRRNFEIADERIHDIPLLSCAAEQKVDRHDL